MVHTLLIKEVQKWVVSTEAGYKLANELIALTFDVLQLKSGKYQYLYMIWQKLVEL